MVLWVWLLIFSILTQVVAEITTKSYSLNGQWKMAAVTLAFNTLSSVLWIAYMRNHSALAVGASIWAVSISVAAFIIGVMLYGEVIETRQYIGLWMGVVALILLT